MHQRGHSRDRLSSYAEVKPLKHVKWPCSASEQGHLFSEDLSSLLLMMFEGQVVGEN